MMSYICEVRFSVVVIIKCKCFYEGWFGIENGGGIVLFEFKVWEVV